MEWIEQNVFGRYRVEWAKLQDYGFVSDTDNSCLLKRILQETGFLTEIRVYSDSRVEGRLFDVNFTDDQSEYRLFRNTAMQGEFVHQVREAYERLLLDIREHCFYQVPFLTRQMNRIAERIMERYGDKPNFEWPEYPHGASFRFRDKGCWYAIVMNTDCGRFEKDKSGEIEILEVRLTQDKIKRLLSEEGFYPQYGMNRNWISIVMNDLLSDDFIMELVAESYDYVCGDRAFNEWIVPANATYYDVCGEFESNDITIWKQSTNLRAGDYLYLYVTAPVSAMKYRCRVIETNIPYEYEDQNTRMSYVCRVHVLNRYPDDRYPLEVLSRHGIKSVRGPRHLTKSLSAYIAENGDKQEENHGVLRLGFPFGIGQGIS